MEAEDFRCCRLTWRGERLKCGKCGRRFWTDKPEPEVKRAYPDRPYRPTDEPAHMIFARSLRVWMTKRGITRKGLAVACRTSRQQIYRLEHGKVSPSLNFIQRFADALGVPLTAMVAADDTLREIEALRPGKQHYGAILEEVGRLARAYKPAFQALPTEERTLVHAS